MSRDEVSREPLAEDRLLNYPALFGCFLHACEGGQVADSAEAFLKIRSLGAGEVVLATPEDATQFVSDQEEYWRWITDIEDDAARSSWSRIETYLNAFRRSLTDGTYQVQATKIFTTIGIPLKGSDFASYVERMAEDDPRVAATCLAISIGAIEVNFKSRAYQRGFAALVAWDQKLSQDSVGSARQSLDELMSSLRRQLASAKGQGTKLLKDINDAENRAAKATRIGVRYFISRLRFQRKNDDLRIGASVDEMAATKALYMEHMALSAPVEYWKKKAGQHKRQSDTARNILVLFALVGGGALVVALSIISSYAISVASAEKPAAVYFVLATIGVVITTIVFWSGRVLTRLYLSELHLSMDAGERATMVETYLALTSVNQATKEDRAIVLASLFRPTADGIVKDDAAPDMSPGSIISKVLTPR